MTSEFLFSTWKHLPYGGDLRIDGDIFREISTKHAYLYISKLKKSSWIKYYIMYIHWSRDSVFNKRLSIGSIGRNCLMALSIGLRLQVLDIILNNSFTFQRCCVVIRKILKRNFTSSSVSARKL